MKILILGNDGRAHALVWKLFNSPVVSEVVCAPGNGGTSQLAPSADLDAADAAQVGRWAFDEGFDIIVPAASQPLQAGVVDEVISLQISVCGPPSRSTQIEASRCYAKEFMLRHRLPTAPGRAFENVAIAEKYLAAQPMPVIIKADHPAGGEAVFADRYAAIEGLHDIFAVRPIEGPSHGVVIEACLSGPRVALSAFSDGRSSVPLLATRLYDRVESNDAGLQARGIGAHTSASSLARKMTEYLHQYYLTPVLNGLASDGLPYWGILGLDCIITAEGPRLTAMRCSMHEGEAQVVLPRLEGDLLPWIQAMIARRLHELPPPTWAPVATVGIGLFARGYPGYFATGGAIEGVDILDDRVLVFHSATENSAGLRYAPAATSRSPGWLPSLGSTTMRAALRVAGGLPLTIVANGATLAGARGHALVNAEKIRFEACTYRADIGAREFN